MKTENIKLFALNSKNFKQINTSNNIKKSRKTIPPRNKIRKVFNGFLRPIFMDKAPKIKLVVAIIPAARNAK